MTIDRPLLRASWRSWLATDLRPIGGGVTLRRTAPDADGARIDVIRPRSQRAHLRSTGPETASRRAAAA